MAAPSSGETAAAHRDPRSLRADPGSCRSRQPLLGGAAPVHRADAPMPDHGVRQRQRADEGDVPELGQHVRRDRGSRRDERVIAVDLDNGVTRVLNSDYFGESKKGGLRMWNRKVYELGGLALHAGLKVIPTASGERVFMIIGLSGTGKTTTTFTTQNDSLPVQDDFVALMPGGRAYGTENGCFAKTFSLDPEFEPNIYDAVIKPTTYLENVYQDPEGRVNFFEQSYTQNGRAVFAMDDLARHRDATEVGTVDYLLILNRNENIIPAVAKLDQEQAAAYFMLGETTGTSAGGAAEAGRFLRVPGTNPFFPLPHGLQGNRILELLATHPIETYLLNTGRVGGKDGDDRSKKVRIPHTSACVLGIAEGSISWTDDDAFGYFTLGRPPAESEAGDELQAREHQGDQEVPAIRVEVVERRAPGRRQRRVDQEHPGDREPQPAPSHHEARVQKVVDDIGALERSADPHPGGAHAAQREDRRRDGLGDPHRRAAAARPSASITSASVVWSNERYHSPTARKGDGVASTTTSSASVRSRSSDCGGATGTARTTRSAPRARAHRSAATDVPPVATPSSTTIATRPRTSTGGRSCRYTRSRRAISRSCSAISRSR